MYGFVVTYEIWGGGGVLIGLMLGIVGIVPLEIIAASWHSEWVIVAEGDARDGIADQGHDQHVRSRRQFRYSEHVGELLVAQPVPRRRRWPAVVWVLLAFSDENR